MGQDSPKGRLYRSSKSVQSADCILAMGALYLPELRLQTMAQASSTFMELVRMHEGIVRKVCHAYTRQRADFEDLYQEILLQWWRAFPSYRGESSFATWAYRIAINTAITDLRKQQKRPIADELPTSLPTAYDSDQAAAFDLLKQAMQELSKADRALLILHFDGYKYREIAEMMQMTTSHVGVKIKRIKAQLQRIIQQYEAL